MMDMDMSSTTTAMSMATSTSSSSSDDMSSMMSMADMTMTFFKASGTPLFSDSWAPSSEGQYAGTCIFLIVLALILRLLLALRPIFEERFWKNYPTFGSDKQQPQSEKLVAGRDVDPGKTVQTITSEVAVRWRGWRTGAAAARATYEVIIGGVGYLLMIAVMTMNLGYFLSVLGGIWLGTFIVGGMASSHESAYC